MAQKQSAAIGDCCEKVAQEWKKKLQDVQTAAKEKFAKQANHLKKLNAMLVRDSHCLACIFHKVYR